MGSLISKAGAEDAETVGWSVVMVLSLILTVITVVQHASTKFFAEKNVDETKLPPAFNLGLPLVGNILAFLKDPVALLWAGYAKHGDVFSVRLAIKRITFLVGPAASEAIFRATDLQLDQSEVNSFLTPVFGDDVAYDAPLEKRNQQMRFLGHTLKPDIVQSYIPLMIKEVKDFFSTWGNEGEVDLYEELTKLITLSSSRCILGREIRENVFAEVSHLIHDLGLGFRQISMLAPRLPIKAHRIRDRARKQISKIFEHIISNRRAGMTREDDMLQALVEAKYNDGTEVKDHEIVGILIAALFGAQHTVSISAIWLGMRLLRDKSSLRRVMEEQKTISDETGGRIDHDALLKMKFLHVCIKETVRMDMSSLFVMRKVLEPRPVLGGRFVIPKNDYVVTSPRVAGMLPSIFKDPKKWDPERFLHPREEGSESPYSYLSFGGGRHLCKGQAFAYLQIKIIWSILLNLFEVEAIGNTVPDSSNDMPHGLCLMKYKRKVPLPP